MLGKGWYVYKSQDHVCVEEGGQVGEIVCVQGDDHSEAVSEGKAV